jgi:hypothetical protein
MPANAKTSKRNNPSPDPYVATLLGRVSEGKHVMSVPQGKKIFSQGDRADAIYFTFFTESSAAFDGIFYERHGGYCC